MRMVTKSVRLTPEEAEELAQTAEQSVTSEAALTKKWILTGIHKHRLDRAIQAYIQRKVDLRGGAAMAEVSYNRFLREIQDRNIVILEDKSFLERLYRMGEVFDNEELQAIIRRLEQ